ncbi:MAG: nuclear transport factor 2 family protein [Terriglobales bacterium]
MYAVVGLLAVSALLALAATAPIPASGDAEVIVGLEKAALERWAAGDPDGFLEISDDNVTYFDPFIRRRVDGKQALKDLYAAIRGKFKIERFEMLDPKVQLNGDLAVLTFNFVSQGTEGAMRWNTTEVYSRTARGWRIIHTHWSLTQPQLAKEQTAKEQTTEK